ncbi:MAG: 23S rRNA (guanine(745)-N(1))-methyltransferase [Methylococcales bacterium]
MSILNPELTVHYLCPLCNLPLHLEVSKKTYACQNRHSFDRAKEGYLNLLPVQFKHSKEPGDSKQMLTARRQFLEAGFYEPLAKGLAMIINVTHKHDQIYRLLDLGCGEGYYSRQIERYCEQSHRLLQHGNDIAKVAIAAAAKKQPSAQFVVASSSRLPYSDNYFDLVLRIFAPCDDKEINRVLKPSSHLLTVTPGPRHLWQLKEFIYDDVKEHAEESTIPEGFELLTNQRISYKIAPNSELRTALLQMTPFAWSAGEQIQTTLSNLSELEIEVDFILTLSRKTPLAIINPIN